MLGEFDFHLLQIQSIKAAMDQLPTYQPLAKTPAQMQTEYDNALAVRADYLTKLRGLSLARGELHEKTEEAHQVAIGVYGVMKSRYRKDPGSLEAINGLPTQDQTFEQTRVRMDDMSSLWSQLPDDPYADPPGPMVAWPGMDQTAFDATRDTMVTAHSNFVTTNGAFEKAEGDLHAKDAQLGNLAVDSLAEGRGQFAEGTPEREVIDAIPTEPAQQPPDQAVIGVATSPGVGQAHLEFSANHATSYDVFQRLAGEPDFVLVADDIIETSYDASDLPAGTYEFQVIGQNSRGNGPPSAVATIEVAGAVATAAYGTGVEGTNTAVWVYVPPELVDVQTLYLQHGGTPFFTAFSPTPGTVARTTWPGMVISGAIDEVKLQNGSGEDIAVGIYDPMLPDPGP